MNLEDILTKNDLETIRQIVLDAVSKIVPNPESPYLTIDQAAEFIHRKPCTLRKLAHAGEIAYYMVGGDMMFKREDLVTYMEQRRIKSNYEIEAIAAGRF